MIYFVRHGETDYNVAHRTQGQVNTKLTEKGLEQTKQSAMKLKDVHIDVIYSSPLSRARAVAEEINKYHNVEIKFDDRLMERYAGRRQGTYWKDLTDEEKRLWQTNPELWGAESRLEFYKRCVEFFKEVENTDKDIVLASHGGVWRNIMRYLDNEDTDFSKDLKHEIDNCGIDILDDYKKGKKSIESYR